MEGVLFGILILVVLAFILSRLERVGSDFLLGLLTLVMWPVGVILALERRRGPGPVVKSRAEAQSAVADPPDTVEPIPGRPEHGVYRTVGASAAYWQVGGPHGVEK